MSIDTCFKSTNMIQNQELQAILLLSGGKSPTYCAWYVVLGFPVQQPLFGHPPEIAKASMIAGQAVVSSQKLADHQVSEDRQHLLHVECSTAPGNQQFPNIPLWCFPPGRWQFLSIKRITLQFEKMANKNSTNKFQAKILEQSLRAIFSKASEHSCALCPGHTTNGGCTR